MHRQHQAINPCRCFNLQGSLQAVIIVMKVFVFCAINFITNFHIARTQCFQIQNTLCEVCLPFSKASRCAPKWFHSTVAVGLFYFFLKKVPFNLRGVGTLHMEYYLNLLYCMKSEIFLAVIWMISCLGWMNRLHSNSKSSNLYIRPFSCLEKRWECANSSQH